MSEAEDNRNTWPSWMTLDEAIEWIAFRGQPFELLPSQDPVTGEEIDQPHHRELLRRLRPYLLKGAHDSELMPALKDGTLVALSCSANDRFAEPKPLQPIAWRGLDYVEQLTLRRSSRTDVVLLVAEARVRELWPQTRGEGMPEDDDHTRQQSKFMSLAEAIEWWAFQGQPPKQLPPAWDEIDELPPHERRIFFTTHAFEHIVWYQRREERAAEQHRIRSLEKAKDQMLPFMQAGQLPVQSEQDPLNPQRVNPSFWDRQRLDECAAREWGRPPPSGSGSSRIAAVDRPLGILFRVERALLKALRQAFSDKAAEAELKPGEPQPSRADAVDFVTAFAKANPEIGADTIYYEHLPAQLRVISRDRVRKAVKKARGEPSGN